MKKLLGLLSVLTITGTAVPTTIAASPYEKQYKVLKRTKRQNDKITLNNLFNEIGKVKKCTQGFFFSNNWNHSYYFLRLTPIFWQEIINLYNNENKDNFSQKVEAKIKNIFSNVLHTYSNEITLDDIGQWIYDNWKDIDKKWQNSNKTKRIEIRFTIKQETELPTRDQIFTASYDPGSIELNTWLIANFQSFNIVPDIDDFYWRNESIIEEILEKIDYFGADLIEIDLGIIDNDDNKTILNAFIKKYPNFKTSELEVINKSLYSHFPKFSSVELKINNSDKVLKPKLIFNSKIKLKELSDKIEKDKNFILLKNHLKDYYNDLPTRLEKLKSFNNSGWFLLKNNSENDKKVFQLDQKEILKSYIRDFNQIMTLIENDWKIDELQNNMTLEFKNINNDISDLKKEIEKIQEKLDKITDISFFPKIWSNIKDILNKNSTKITIFYFPAIWHWTITGYLIYNALSLINNLSNDNIEYKTNKNNNDEKQKYFDIQNFLNFEYQISYSDLNDKKYLDDIFALLLNIQYDVPADGNCLFWSVATPYLLSVRNNNLEFKRRFIQLFGEQEEKILSYVQTLLQQFDLENNSNNQFWYQNQTANNLVTNVFRNRVVDYIQSHLDTISTRNGELTFRNLVQENNAIADNYLKRMRDINSWGGTPEIIAMSNILNSNISVNNDNPYQPINQNSSNTINLFHVNDRTHYNFGLENQNNNEININIQNKNNSNNTSSKRGGGHSQSNNANNFILLALNEEQLKNNEYHFSNQETEQNSLKNSENLKINLINNKNKIVNKYNMLLKNEKQNKLNEINQHYQNLSENDKKDFIDKLKAIGTSAIGAGISGVGTKITVSGSVANSVGTTSEAIEMIPLLSEGELIAAETLSVSGETTIVATEGAVIGTEAATAGALAPETLGLSLVIGGLAIAGTALIWWLSDHDNTEQAVKHESHNQYNEIEKYYKFLAHDQLKLDININEWNKIMQIYQENANNYQEFKNKVKSEITNFHKEDHSGWGGTISDDDIDTLIKIIFDNFQEINNHFLSNPNHGWKIITNTIGSYFIIEEE